MILFDFLNEKFGTRGATANRLVHDLESLESADYVYLYCITLDGKLIAVHPLPGPEDEPAPPGAAPWTKQIKPLLDRTMRTFTALRDPVDDLDPLDREPLTYPALNAAAADLARAPGRKSLDWLTAGVPIEIGPNRTLDGQGIDFTQQLRQMTEEFDRAGVAIYPSRQVMMGSPEGMGPAGSTGMGSIDTLTQFAELTGGRPDGGKDIGSAVRSSHDRLTRTSYQVGYYPAASNWDDKFHKLHITCTRKGVRIQAKTAYYRVARARLPHAASRPLSPRSWARRSTRPEIDLALAGQRWERSSDAAPRRPHRRARRGFRSLGDTYRAERCPLHGGGATPGIPAEGRSADAAQAQSERTESRQGIAGWNRDRAGSRGARASYQGAAGCVQVASRTRLDR